MFRLLLSLCALLTISTFVNCYLPNEAYCGPDVDSFQNLINVGPTVNKGVTFSSHTKPNPNSWTFKLIHSQFVTRHGDRTIIDRGTCWVGDSASYQCDLTTTAVPNNDLSITSESSPQTIFRLSFLEDENYFPGNCSSGGLSSKGSKQLIQSGQILRSEYIDSSTPFLPKTLNSQQVYFRTDNELRTLQSAESLIIGLYPPSNVTGTVEVLDIWSMDYDLDDMQVNTNLCPVVNDLYAAALLSPEFQDFNSTVAQPLFRNLSSIVGYPVDSSNFYHVWDCAVVHKCWNKGLPAGIDAPLLDSMNSALTWVSEHVYAYPTIQLGSQTGIGFLLKEIYLAMNQAVQAALTGQPITPRFLLYSGHDTTVLPMLVAYDISDHLWPPYASFIIIELYQNVSSSSSALPTEDDLFVRFVYNSKPLLLPGCDASIGDGLCEYSVYKQTTETLIPPDDYESFCASSASTLLSESLMKSRREKLEGKRRRGGVERGHMKRELHEREKLGEFEEKMRLAEIAKAYTRMRKIA